MILIPFVLSILVLVFKFMFGLDIMYIYNIDIIIFMTDSNNNDKGIDVNISKEAMKETATVVSEGVNRLAVNVGGYDTAAVAASGIQKVVTSGGPLGAKAAGVVGLSVIGTAEALAPAVSKVFASKQKVNKSNSENASSFLDSNDQFYDFDNFKDTLEQYSVINNYFFHCLLFAFVIFITNVALFF